MKIHSAIEFNITEQSTEQVVAEMPLRASSLNPFGILHAGAMLWLAADSWLRLWCERNRSRPEQAVVLEETDDLSGDPSGVGVCGIDQCNRFLGHDHRGHEENR